MAEYDQLASLRALVHAEREKLKEKLACGHTGAEETVGRCKALEWVVQRISEQIKSLNGTKGDEK